MIRYFAASALAKRYVLEEGTESVRLMFEDAPAYTSRLTAVEVALALTRRAREGALEVPERDRLLNDVDRDTTEMFLVELTPEVASSARDLLLRHSLRASDAVHLASCLTLRTETGDDTAFVAFDARLRAAADAEGIKVEP